MMRALAAMMMLSCLAAAPATRKATTAPLDPLQIRAQDLVESNNIKSLVGEIDAQLPALLADLKKLDANKLIRLAMLREISVFFGRIGEINPNAKTALRWLIAQPKLAPALMLTTGEFDPPDRVLEVLAALWAEEHEKLEEFPDLTAAMCVVWDAPERFGPGDETKLDRQRVVRIFRYYSNDAPMPQLPVELLCYVVDNALSENEIDWVRKRYKRRADVPAAFSDVAFNEGAYFERDPAKELSDKSYLMLNLQRMGGRCADSSYFAAQVGKTMGVGTVVCNAIGYDDKSPGASWTGYLQPAGPSVKWNFNAARYPEHDAWPAEMVDPQTMNSAPPADAEVLALLAATKPGQRNVSAALAKAASAGNGFDVLMKAIDLSPGNRIAWFALADLSDNQKLSAAQTAQVVEKVNHVLLPVVPDFALRLRLRMIAHRGDDLQIAEMSAMARSFSSRADLAGQIKLAEADLHIAAKQRDDAIRCCGEAIELRSPAITYLAMLRVDRLLRDEQTERLIEIYGKVFDEMPRPRPSVYAHTLPYDLVGRRYAELLDDAKRKQQAVLVRSKLDAVMTSGMRR